jgi:hypothetical protein
MDNAPWFDHPDQFDQKSVSPTSTLGTDIIYLHRAGVRVLQPAAAGRTTTAECVPHASTCRRARRPAGSGTTCLVIAL